MATRADTAARENEIALCDAQCVRIGLRRVNPAVHKAAMAHARTVCAPKFKRAGCDITAATIELLYAGQGGGFIAVFGVLHDGVWLYASSESFVVGVGGEFVFATGPSWDRGVIGGDSR